MAETNLVIKCAAVGNDCDESSAGVVNNSNNFIRCSSSYTWQSHRMASCVVDQGAYIVSAIFQVYVYNDDDDNINARYYLVDIDGAGNAPTTTNGISNLTRTSAYVDVLQSNVQNGTNQWVDVADLKDCLQEVVSRTGFVSGNAINIIGNFTGTTETFHYRSRDYSSIYAAKLDITWDTDWPAAGGIYRPPALGAIGAAGRISPTIGV